MTISESITDTSDYAAVFAGLENRAPALAGTDAAERIEKIQRLYRAVYDLRAEIGQAGQAELNMDGRLALLPLKQEIDYVCEHLAGWMQSEDMESTPSLMGRRAYIHWESKGVVLHLATWNSPVLICFSPLVSMIAAGNAVVLKPSELAPQSAELVARVVERAGLSDDIAVVLGGPETAQALLKLPFNHICYVGNNRVGRLVMEAAAQHFAGVTLEMGGKNPAIVEHDADISDAAAKLVYGRNMIAGQVCLSPDYVLVHESVKEDLIAAMQYRAKAFFDPYGRGYHVSADLARIVNERHTLRIKALMDDAISKGALLRLGGEVDAASRFVAPAILDGVNESMDIFHEEIFGPVLLIQSFVDRRDAVAEIRRRHKPLGLYIFTRDQATADWYLAHTRSGTAAINSVLVQANNPTLPFGGVNHSGIGRLGGKAGFQEFSNGRGVVEDAYDPKQGAPMFYPPMAIGTMQFIDGMLAPAGSR